jgi:hypothetical protein
MDNSEIPGSLPLDLGKTYKVMLQYGLFNDDNDSDKSKVRGIIEFSEALEMTLPTTMKKYIPYSAAKNLLAISSTIILATFILFY